MNVRINRVMPKDFARLALKCGRDKHTAIAVTTALRDCAFMVGVYDESKLVAFGRVISDGALCYFVCDVMVDPEYDVAKLEKRVLKEIEDYFLAVTTREARIYVVADRPFDSTCIHFGYKYLNPDSQVIMKK